MTREEVAVVGSGVSGLTAAHLLQRHYDVVLFEADDRLGGHAHTHEHASPDSGLIRVDSGFIVHNRVTYPNLIRLFEELQIPTVATEMSMSVRCDGCGLEYAGARGLGGVFAQPRSAVRGRFLRMLTEVRRFHRHAKAVVAGAGGMDDQTTLGSFLDQGRYSRYFIDHYLVPVVSAVWSAAPDTALLYPARYLFSFLANHGMLSVKGSHQWYTVAGGSETYVRAVAKNLTEVHLATPVTRMVRSGDGSAVTVTTGDGRSRRFGRAVVATHPDTALRLLGDATAAEVEVLGAFRYSRNATVLHQDAGVLPRRDRARAAWNYLLPTCPSAAGSPGGDPGRRPVLVSYDMNRLQHLPGGDTYVVSLNATDRIDETRVIARMVYEHPIYTPQAVQAQKRLPELERGPIAFAGAYHGWGFHEDGCRAGVAAAARFGAGW